MEYSRGWSLRSSLTNSSGRKPELGRVEQEVDDLAPVKILVEFRADVRVEQVAQKSVGGVALGNGGEEFLVRRADLEVVDQRQPDRFLRCRRGW